MLDIKYILNNTEKIKKSIKDRNLSIDLDLFIDLHEKRKASLLQLEALAHERKALSKIPPQNIDTKIAAEGRLLKEKILKLEALHKTLEKEYHNLLERIPNLIHPDVPIGKEDKNNSILKHWGTIPQFDFTPKSHIELAEMHNLVDFEQAAKVTGQKFYFLKNQAVVLDLALQQFALDILQKKDFKLFQTPDLAKPEIIKALGFHARGPESNVYMLEDGLGLIGTAEITLGGYFYQKKLSQSELPLKVAGLSHCFRKEAGSAGQYSKGLYRVHQFTKIEMFIVCAPEDSEQYHHELLKLEEEIFQKLEIPYRVVDTCSASLGNPSYRKFDIEAWLPGRGGTGDFGEITSTSNCLDYQSRRLRLTYIDKNGNKIFPHLLNGTAIANTRTILAIMENCQQKDGSIVLPKALQPYCAFDTIPFSKG